MVDSTGAVTIVAPDGSTTPSGRIAPPVKPAAFSSSGALLLSSEASGAFRVSSITTGASLEARMAAGEWVVYTPDGYFDGSRNAGLVAAAAYGMDAYALDQLAVRVNRPDIVLQRLGLGNPELWHEYALRHQRRLRVSGLADDAGAIGRVTAPDVTMLDASREGAQARIVFEARAAQGSALAGTNVFVNGVPLFGTAGEPASGSVAHKEIRVALSAGPNHIEVTAFDTRGTEALRTGALIEGPEQGRRRLHFIGFGVSKYRDERLNLELPDKDVRDLAGLLDRSAVGPMGWDAASVHYFTNEQVTREQIASSRQLVAEAAIDDTVVVFLAGHGVHSRNNGEYYFATYDTDVKRLEETAASFELIEQLLAATPARHRLLLLDTCESGERDENVPAGLRARGARALVFEPEAKGPGQAAPVGRLGRDPNRMIENNLFRRTGAVVFSSSRGAEPSFEYPEIGNGVFTAGLMGALTGSESDTDSNGVLTPVELARAVSAFVIQKTDAQQHPAMDRDNPEAGVELPVVAGATPSTSKKKR